MLFECGFNTNEAEPQLSVISCQLSALEVILKFEDLEVWKRSSRLCADLYKHFQDVMGMLFTDN